MQLAELNDMLRTVRNRKAAAEEQVARHTKREAELKEQLAAAIESNEKALAEAKAATKEAK